jgi:hypothetical protein
MAADEEKYVITSGVNRLAVLNGFSEKAKIVKLF